jgi:hypothetical protein
MTPAVMAAFDAMPIGTTVRHAGVEYTKEARPAAAPWKLKEDGEWWCTPYPPAEALLPADAVLHPNGRCTCAGEGTCETWCRKPCPTCGVANADHGDVCALTPEKP